MEEQLASALSESAKLAQTTSLDDVLVAIVAVISTLVVIIQRLMPITKNDKLRFIFHHIEKAWEGADVVEDFLTDPVVQERASHHFRDHPKLLGAFQKASKELDRLLPDTAKKSPDFP